ncbi:MAG TPA: cytochrome c maturation protein CcmE [Vicinamibacterales bacterium]|nr:cytochrome c maturation protein CcmE [Vicinamibacterales bacterium]
MNSKTIKILATAVVLVGALGGLMYTSLAEGTEYYKHVDEVMADPAPWHGKKLQLHGYVVERSIKRKPDTLEYIFQLENNGHVVNARYTGIVPDTFKDNSETVIKGRFADDGTFMVEPGGVMAKCPSKYEASKTPRAPGT